MDKTELVSYEVLVFGLGSFSAQILDCDVTLDNRLLCGNLAVSGDFFFFVFFRMLGAL